MVPFMLKVIGLVTIKKLKDGNINEVNYDKNGN